MPYDIYGNPLKRGHCEVHPWINVEHPCPQRQLERLSQPPESPVMAEESKFARLREVLNLLNEAEERINGGSKFWGLVQDAKRIVEEIVNQDHRGWRA